MCAVHGGADRSSWRDLPRKCSDIHAWSCSRTARARADAPASMCRPCTLRTRTPQAQDGRQVHICRAESALDGHSGFVHAVIMSVQTQFCGQCGMRAPLRQPAQRAADPGHRKVRSDQDKETRVAPGRGRFEARRRRGKGDARREDGRRRGDVRRAVVSQTTLVGRFERGRGSPSPTRPSTGRRRSTETRSERDGRASRNVPPRAS